ncbi:hypothetical protein B0H13DRAFT_1912554 [Mycena leptocephala]|nr:hypothetical protein B0H13DRAFT_1912554 [Mycena leptocephala]
MLRDLAPHVFSKPLPRTEPEPVEGGSENPVEPVDVDSEDEESDDLILLTHSVLGENDTVTDGSKSKKSPLFNDIFHRPPSLQTTCAWDLFVHYEKCALPKSKNSYKEFLRFATGHPQYTSHCMKRLTSTELPRVLVLAGFPIPRSDKEDQKESYRIAMLTLFHPWSDNEASPLKPEGCDWDTAFDDMDATLSPKHRRILSNMQLLYQSRDAKHDYSELRRRRMAELARSSVLSSSRREDDTDTYDPAWENAMQTDVDGAGTYGEDLTSTVTMTPFLLKSLRFLFSLGGTNSSLLVAKKKLQILVKKRTVESRMICLSQALRPILLSRI